MPVVPKKLRTVSQVTIMAFLAPSLLSEHLMWKPPDMIVIEAPFVFQGPLINGRKTMTTTTANRRVANQREALFDSLDYAIFCLYLLIMTRITGGQE